MEGLKRRDALEIINALKAGTPPPVRLLHHLHVGRERWLEGMAWFLDAAKNADLSTGPIHRWRLRERQNAFPPNDGSHGVATQLHGVRGHFKPRSSAGPL